jgi:hypothetical protein
MPLPELPWAVADYAMDEHLGPALARLSEAGEPVDRLAVYRPYPMRWDTLQVTVRPLDTGVLLAIVRQGESLDVLFVEKDGTLLYVERVEPFPLRRRPREGTQKAKRVDALLDRAMRLFQP